MATKSKLWLWCIKIHADNGSQKTSQMSIEYQFFETKTFENHTFNFKNFYENGDVYPYVITFDYETFNKQRQIEQHNISK